MNHVSDPDLTPQPRRVRGAEVPVIPPAPVELADEPVVYGEEIVTDVGSVGGELALPPYRGGTTTFRLAHPLNRGHQVLHEGQTVTFAVERVEGLSGVFVGSGGPGDESEHVMDLYRTGMFANTQPAVDRAIRQNAIDLERGVYEGSEEGPPLRSLAALTGRRLEALLRRFHGVGTPEQMRAAESMASHTEAPAQQRVWTGAQAPGTARRP